jgi:hypothetical protein
MSYIKTCYGFVVVLFFSFFTLVRIASAHLEITEIMYDPKGSNVKHQWIEVYNPDSSVYKVDATKFRFNDGSSHYVNNKKDFSIPASSYIILSGDKNTFLSDHSGFSGTVIDTSLTLDKDGDTVSLINDGSAIDQITYTSSQGGAEDGKSLQKINNVLVAATPTPGIVNSQPVETPQPTPVPTPTPTPIPTPIPVVTPPVTPTPVPVQPATPIIVTSPPTLPTPVAVARAIVTPEVKAVVIPAPVPEPQPEVKKVKIVAKKTTAKKVISKKASPIVDLNTLSASAAKSENTNNPTSRSFYIYLGFLAVIIAGVSAILFLRRKNPKDIEIIE